MKYSEFEHEIKKVYAEKFGKSMCLCSLAGMFTDKEITIRCYLASSKDEFPHRISDNDAIQVMLFSMLPHGWDPESDLPESMTFKPLKREIKHKPPKEESFLYCKFTRIPFREKTCSPQEFIKAFKKLIDKLYIFISEQYATNNLLPGDMELYKSKYDT